MDDRYQCFAVGAFPTAKEARAAAERVCESEEYSIEPVGQSSWCVVELKRHAAALAAAVPAPALVYHIDLGPAEETVSGRIEGWRVDADGQETRESNVNVSFDGAVGGAILPAIAAECLLDHLRASTAKPEPAAANETAAIDTRDWAQSLLLRLEESEEIEFVNQWARRTLVGGVARALEDAVNNPGEAATRVANYLVDQPEVAELHAEDEQIESYIRELADEME